jgi:pimeloyl-ACP methyl ester carboxylesterase
VSLRSERVGDFQVLRGGAGPLVIALHGFPDHPPTMAPMLERVIAAGYEVAAPWLRGYAPSTLEGPFDVARLADDVLALATALGHMRFALVGHDWGAMITYTACAAAPERVITAVTMAVPHPRAVVRSLVRSAQLARSWYMVLFQLPGAAALARAGDLALIDLLWRRWSPGLRLDEASRLELHACLDASWPAPIEYYRAMARRPPRWRRVATPLLHLHGADDGCVGVAACRDQEQYFTGRFESEILSDLGHFLHVEDPGRIAARVIAWLRQSQPSP